MVEIERSRASPDLPNKKAASESRGIRKRRVRFQGLLADVSRLLAAARPAIRLRATHAIAAVVTEIAVSVANGDGAAVVAAGSVALEASELIAASPFAAAEIHPGTLEL